MAKLVLDLHDIYNRSDQIDAQLNRVVQEAIAKRIELYHQETEPLVSHYRLAGNLVGIHGDRSEKDVFAEIQEALDQARVAS